MSVFSTTNEDSGSRADVGSGYVDSAARDHGSKAHSPSNRRISAVSMPSATAKTIRWASPPLRAAHSLSQRTESIPQDLAMSSGCCKSSPGVPSLR